MIFYCDLQGNLKAFQNETVYQGSNNVTTIYVVAPFSRPVGLNISFTKPNKLVTSPAIMKWVGTLGNVKIPVSFVNIPEQFTDTYNVWAYALPYSITEQNGVVGVSVNAVIADSVDASGQQAYKGNLTTFTGQFTVAYSALPSPPTDIPTEWTQDKVLDLLNNYYNDAIQKIGEMNTLKTNAKDTLVKAINEVFDEIATTNATIGDLSNLTTDEKTTIVGAINEVDNHADANKAEIGNLSALTTDEKATLVGAINEVDNHADNAITLANNAVATANGAVATANEAKTTAQTAENNANSAVDKANDAVGKANEAIMKADAKATSIGFMTAKDAVTALNGYPRTQLKGGDTIWIVEDGTPDLWVTEVAQESVPYNYTTKDKFNQDLVDNKVLQIGYFKTAYQESDGKPVTIAWQNVLVKSTDWVASTEFADFPYEAKIELTDFVDYTTVPQVVFDIADTMSGNYAPICKSGDKCVYIYGKVQNEITLKTVITFAPNVNGASVTGGGYNNRGKWVASTTYEIDDLVYTDNGQYVCIEGITSTTSPEQDTTHWQATFVATGKTKNGLRFSGQNTDGSAVQKTFDGSTAVEVSFDETTMTAKEVNGVLEIGAKGTIPEALPQEASALKSGSLSTSGWAATENKELYNGKLSFAGAAGSPLNNGKLLPPYNYTSKNNLRDWSGTIISGDNIERCEVYTDKSGVKYVSLYVETGTPPSMYNEVQIYDDGTVKAWTYYSYSTTREVKIVATFLSDYSYTISDADVTTNSDILMEITDANHIVPAPIENGKIKVISNAIPTEPVDYTYKVKQTNASGQFTLVNHYVPKVEIPTIPTKTSELINDSGYVSNLPTVQNVVCNDVESATTLDTTITCEVGDLILAQIIVRSALTLPTGWTLLRTIPAVETSVSQTLSFAYKRATSTSETLTVTQASAGRIYTNLVRLSDAVSISYIQSCEKTGTGITSISSTKPVTPNMVIWGVSSDTWKTSSPYGDWTCSPSTLDYYSLPQSTRAPRLGTFIDSSGAGERTFSTASFNGSADSMMCGAVEIVGDEVARKGDIPTKTSQLTNDSGFVKTSEANTFTAVQTFSNADGIKTDRVHNLDNNDAWYNFDGSNNRFGSPSRPTIIRTSEARPRAQVPSGETTVTKEIALLEDVPSAGAWVDVTGEATTLTQAGTYQVLFGSSNSVQSIIYWDGTNGADGIYSTMPSVTSGRPFINCRYPHITAAGVLSINYDTITEENGTWTKTTSTLSGFKYRKIN